MNDIKELLEEARTVVGPGWWPIVEKYLPQMVALAPEGEIYIKEKYGVLRMDVYGSVLDRAAIDTLEMKALTESETTCEECGAPGTIRTDRFWRKTLCDRCAKKE